MSFQFHRNKTTIARRFCAAFLFVSCATSALTSSAAETWQESALTIIGVKDYFRERCIKFSAGNKVTYQFTSPHPLDFNIHHHPSNKTVFLIEKKNITELSGEFSSEQDDHYCFTWTNNVDLEAKEWPMVLQYRVSPK